MRKIPCPECGNSMTSCSKTCQKCMGRRYQGEGHPKWKGGRAIQKGKGYVQIYKPNHPRANKRSHKIYEHTFVWEQAHNKLLPKGWHIHHLNGIKADNRSINLIALPSYKHSLILEIKAKRIQELEALLNGQHQLL